MIVPTQSYRPRPVRATGRGGGGRIAALMICRNCGTEIADKAIICYRCGTATTDPVRKPAAVRPRRSGLFSVVGIAAARASRPVSRPGRSDDGAGSGWSPRNSGGNLRRRRARDSGCPNRPSSQIAGTGCRIRGRRLPTVIRYPIRSLIHSSTDARRSPRSNRRARPPDRADLEGTLRDRPPRDERSAAWPAARSLATTPKSSSDNKQFVVRDRNSRYGTYVNDEQVTERAARARRPHPPRAQRRRGDGVPPGRDRATPRTRPPRPRSAICGRSPRCSTACARSAAAACSTTCWRW